MPQPRTFTGQYDRRRIVKDLFRDVAAINPRDGESLVIELQQIARDAARAANLKVQR